MPVTAYHCDLINPALPAVLRSAAESGVVIGADLAKTHHLAFILNACTPNKRGWEGFSLAELAVHRKENVIGIADHEALLSLCLKAATSDILSMGASRAVLPKADELLKRRRAMPMSALDPADPATAVIKRAESFLQKAGYRFIEDDIRALAEMAPIRLPIRTSTTMNSTHLVLLISSSITSLETALLGRYLLKTDSMWIRKITVVVEDTVAWSKIKNSVESHVQVVEEFLEPGVAPPEPVPCGHLPWDKDTLIGHTRVLRNLARTALRKGATASDICVVTRNKADACVVRTRLIELGVPVQCSESHLLFMRPGVLTLMSHLSMAHGCNGLVGLIRVAGISSGVAPGELEALFHQLEDSSDEGGVFSKQMTAAFASLHAVRSCAGETPICALKTALLVFGKWASEKDQADAAEYASALFMWAAQFESVRTMLKAFWTMRTLLSGWSGYRNQSGITVTHGAPSEVAKWIVLLLPEELMSAKPYTSDHVNCTLIKAPVCVLE